MQVQDAFLRILSVALTLAALFGVLIAWVTYALLCASSDSGCGDARGIMVTQFAVAGVGLCTALAMAYYSFTGSSRKALVALGVGLIVWAAWAVLNDAAVHGWGDDMVLLRPFG